MTNCTRYLGLDVYRFAKKLAQPDTRCIGNSPSLPWIARSVDKASPRPFTLRFIPTDMESKTRKDPEG